MSMKLKDFVDRFPDLEACVAHLETVRWPKGPVCPKCGVIGNALRPPRPGYWHCRGCRAQFNVLNGTPMEGTHLPLCTWFGAICLAATSSKGVSAMVLSRQLDIGYKTAWFLAQRIRNRMTQDRETVKGLVEVDEWQVPEEEPDQQAGQRRGPAQRARRKPQGDGRGGSRARREGQGEAGALAR
jgi:transposase-like protein